MLNKNRYELILPRRFAKPALILQPEVRRILTHHWVLGKEHVLHSLGAAISEPNTSAPMQWHIDQPYALGTNSLDEVGLAGHDLPSYAVSMITPLLNMTRKHGPTEFCVGSSYWCGAGDYHPGSGGAQRLDRLCPVDSRRVPVLQAGDIALFDYQVRHRGGPNKSKQARHLLYMTFARDWYKDYNFRDTL